MNISAILLSVYEKQCPHCLGMVNTRTLRIVPREEKPRWYQFTPPPHTACSLCGGFVTSTAGNSKWILVWLLFIMTGAIFVFLSPYLRVLLGSFLGRFIIMTFAMAFTGICIWLAVKHSELISEKKQL